MLLRVEGALAIWTFQAGWDTGILQTGLDHPRPALGWSTFCGNCFHVPGTDWVEFLDAQLLKFPENCCNMKAFFAPIHLWILGIMKPNLPKKNIIVHCPIFFRKELVSGVFPIHVQIHQCQVSPSWKRSKWGPSDLLAQRRVERRVFGSLGGGTPWAWKSLVENPMSRSKSSQLS